MQVVIAIPDSNTPTGQDRTADLLVRRVAGIPLLKRTIINASRAGATEIVLISSDILGHALARQFSQDVVSSGTPVRFIHCSTFDPKEMRSWNRLAHYVNDHFVWIPWNWVTSKQFLRGVPQRPLASVNWARPAQVCLHEIGDESTSTLPFVETMGVRITTAESVAAAERFLVAHSGKILDGIHTSFNRRLCRPFVRMLSHTSVTPNQVTFCGVVISVLSSVAFARGGYLYSLLGALLFYIAGLFDEMDGMLARIKFAESPRGTWLEGFADGLSYLLLFGGITIGLSHRYGSAAIVMGGVLLAGVVLALIVTSLQRRRATSADRPNEYLGRMYQLLDGDSGNWISRTVRQLQAFIRRGILVHYIVIFAIIGALPLVFLLAILGAHLTWILTLYFDRRFFAQSFAAGATSTANTIKETA